MPITIDEVVADVATPEGRAQQARGPQSSAPSSASDPRKHREQAERLAQRAARVMAD